MLAEYPKSTVVENSLVTPYDREQEVPPAQKIESELSPFFVSVRRDQHCLGCFE